jgi:mannosyltransferase
LSTDHGGRRARFAGAHVYLGVVVTAAAVTAARLWLPQLGSSFWLDETSTAWLIDGSLGETVGRSFRYQGGSTLFLIVEWLVDRVAGRGEIALRLPSVLGMAATAWFVYALGRRLYDRWAGLLAAGVLVCLPAIAFAASDARPYALALATSSGSALALVRWMGSRRLRDGALYAAAVAATVLLHYVFLLALAAQAVFVAYRLRAGYRIDARTVAPVAGLLALFLLPATPTFLRVLDDRGLLSNPYPSSPSDIFTFLVPPSLLYPLVVTFVGGAAVFGARLRRSGYVEGTIPFFVAWAALPVVALYEISNRTPTNVFVPRFTLMAAPAIALLAGMALRQLRHDAVQVAIVVMLCILAMRYFHTTAHANEDWRSAAAAERSAVDDPDTPVLVFSGFIEAGRSEWLTDPERADYLNAPAAMYPMEGRLIPTPFGLDEAGAAYMETVTREELLPADEFVLVTRGSDPFRAFLDARVAEAGFTAVLTGAFGDVFVYEYGKS